jgi:transcriptional regulator with XRE-family HTH domain
MSPAQKRIEVTKEDRKTLGERLRDAREYLGFSQEDISRYLGVPRSALSLIETGQRKVDAFELKRLAELYKRPLEYFTGDNDVASSFTADIKHLARKVSELSQDDIEELSRFADFLRARKQKGGTRGTSR